MSAPCLRWICGPMSILRSVPDRVPPIAAPSQCARTTKPTVWATHSSSYTGSPVAGTLPHVAQPLKLARRTTNGRRRIAHSCFGADQTVSQHQDGQCRAWHDSDAASSSDLSTPPGCTRPGKHGTSGTRGVTGGYGVGQGDRTGDDHKVDVTGGARMGRRRSNGRQTSAIRPCGVYSRRCPGRDPKTCAFGEAPGAMLPGGFRAVA